MFDALFEALFSYRPVVFREGDFRFDVTAASFVAALIVGVVVAAAIFTYRRVQVADGRVRDRVILTSYPPFALLDDTERGRLEALSRGPSSRHDTATLTELLVERASSVAERTALAWPDGSVSYRELFGRAAAVADELAQRGIGQDDLVLLYADRSPEALIGMVGILLAGAGYVPIDPRLPAERVAPACSRKP